MIVALEYYFWKLITEQRHHVENFAIFNIFVATALLSISPEMAKTSLFIYWMYLPGHIILSTTLALIIKEKRLLYLNIGFIFLDAYAIFVRW